jgi:Holliday junction DNA helicase RuvA
MIASITGTLVTASPLLAIVELNGFGYEVHIPVTTAERLPAQGETVRLHTFVVYREDARTLYGFTTTAERDFFRLMIENVKGVGPKLALNIMSRLSLNVLEGTIRAGDVATLAKSPGIGRKTAERLVVELKGKLGGGRASSSAAAGSASGTSPVSGTAQQDAVAALIALGYRATEADQAVRNAMLAVGPNQTAESLIKKALAG